MLLGVLNGPHSISERQQLTIKINCTVNYDQILQASVEVPQNTHFERKRALTKGIFYRGW